MRRNKILAVVLILALVLTLPIWTEQVGEAVEQELTGSVVFQINTAAYFINNQVPSVEMDVAPFIKDGRTLVSVRFLANALGVDSANISWDNPIVLPARFVAEALGY